MFHRPLGIVQSFPEPSRNKKSPLTINKAPANGGFLLPVTSLAPGTGRDHVY